MAGAQLVDIPELTGPVVDKVGVLSSDFQAQLTSRLLTFSRDRGSQIGVLIVRSTKPEEIEQYSIRVVDKWKLGREKFDDGALLIIAIDDRRLRIEVGYGLEGAIPDIKAKRIIEEIIKPRFKSGDIPGGVLAGIDSIEGLIKGEDLPSPIQSTDSNANFIGYAIIFFTVGEFVYLALGGMAAAAVNLTLAGALVTFSPFIPVFLGLIISLFFLLFINSKATYVIDSGRRGSSWSSGGGRSGGFSSGSFGGGGGGFGGGGASGSW